MANKDFKHGDLVYYTYFHQLGSRSDKNYTVDKVIDNKVWFTDGYGWMPINQCYHVVDSLDINDEVCLKICPDKKIGTVLSIHDKCVWIFNGTFHTTYEIKDVCKFTAYVPAVGDKIKHYKIIHIHGDSAWVVADDGDASGFLVNLPFLIELKGKF